jgi:rod shape-determining protein MreC
MNNKLPGYFQTVMFVLIVAGVLILAISGYLNTAIQSASHPLITVQTWISTRYQAVYDFFTVPRDVASLREQVAAMENEINLLKTENIELEQALLEASVVSELLGFARNRPENQYVAASVIGRDPSPFLHYVIINQGSDQGLRYGMPVVTQQGLVGRIDAVIGGAARVQLITDPGAIVNVTLQNAGADGAITGSLTGDINLEMITQDVALVPGDLVLTSGLGGAYPQDILVGQVVTIRKRETDLFQTAAIQPVVDFSSLQAVLVIKNFTPVDISPLLPENNP